VVAQFVDDIDAVEVAFGAVTVMSSRREAGVARPGHRSGATGRPTGSGRPAEVAAARGGAVPRRLPNDLVQISAAGDAEAPAGTLRCLKMAEAASVELRAVSEV
jgi:hypothetical protein